MKATLHWVSAAHAVEAKCGCTIGCFRSRIPERAEDGRTFVDHMNPASLEVLPNCQAEPSLAHAVAPDRFQFERLGYFCVDPDSRPGALVFNRTVSLRDTWARIEQKT